MSKGTKRSKRAAKDDDEDDEEDYMDLDEHGVAIVAESKASDGYLDRGRRDVKAQMLEEKLDREVDEEFERLRMASRPAPPLASPKTHGSRSVRARDIRRTFKM